MKDAEAGIAHKPPQQRQVTWRSPPLEVRDQDGHASQRYAGGGRVIHAHVHTRSRSQIDSQLQSRNDQELHEIAIGNDEEGSMCLAPHVGRVHVYSGSNCFYIKILRLLAVSHICAWKGKISRHLEIREK